MTHQIYDQESERNENDHEWTTDRLIDELFLCLVTDKKKSYGQAKDLMFRIPCTEQNPNASDEALEFVLNFNDLSPRVQKEFQAYCDANDRLRVKLLLKEVVMRIFENLDYDYAHERVMKKLRVKVTM